MSSCPLKISGLNWIVLDGWMDGVWMGWGIEYLTVLKIHDKPWSHIPCQYGNLMETYSNLSNMKDGSTKNFSLSRQMGYLRHSVKILKCLEYFWQPSSWLYTKHPPILRSLHLRRLPTSGQLRGVYKTQNPHWRASRAKSSVGRQSTKINTRAPGFFCIHS